MQTTVMSGQQCVECLAGRMTTRSVYDSGEWHTRYLVCTKCKARRKQVLTSDEVKRRRSCSLKQTSGRLKQTGSMQSLIIGDNTTSSKESATHPPKGGSENG